MVFTNRRYLISALKLATAAWWIPFLVTSSSFSRAVVRSLRLSFPSRLKFKACNLKKKNESIKAILTDCKIWNQLPRRRKKIQCYTWRISVLFSIPSSSQASRIYSTGVKPVPSSRVENRRTPMVLVRADRVAILRPPSSNGCMSQ